MSECRREQKITCADCITRAVFIDECKFASLLKALPDASEEILRIAEALLRGYGEVQFYTSPGYRKTVFTWTQRGKEA